MQEKNIDAFSEDSVDVHWPNNARVKMDTQICDHLRKGPDFPEEWKG